MQKRKGDIVSQIYNKMEIEVNQEITDIITAVQNDSNSRYLDVVLLDGGAPLDLTGEEVRIYMKKPDGTEIFNDGEITDAAAGRCQFLLTTQALGAVGVMHAQISIWKDNTEILTTQAFHIYVTKSLISEGSVESSNEYGALVLLFQNLYQSLDLMTDMVAQIGQTDDTGASTTAGTVNGKLNQVQNLIADLDGDVGDFQSIAAKEATVNALDDKIGETTDTGGSSAAGTVMGKLNKIIIDGAQQSTLSVVSTRMGATTDTGASVTAGTVMAKLNYIIDNLTTGQTRQLKLASGTASLSGTSTDLLNITGSGELRAANFYTSTSTSRSLYLTVLIDGVEILSYNNNVNNDYAPYYLSSLGPDESDQMMSIGYNSSDTGPTAPIMHPIPFKNSCIVRALAGSSGFNVYYYIWYAQ